MLQNVRPASSTGIVLAFDKSIAATATLTPEQFIIVDASGSLLAVRKVRTSGNTIIVDTDPQQPDKIYVVGFLQPIAAADGAMLDIASQQMSFNGFKPILSMMPVASTGYGRAPGMGTASSSTPDRTAPENPASMNLRSWPEGDGEYKVTAVWQGSIDSMKDLAGYKTYESTGNGLFIPGAILGRDQYSIEYSNVQPGTFGVKVTSLDQAGNESVGIQKFIELPKSGAGLTAIIGLSGIFAGRKLKRRKEKKSE